MPNLSGKKILPSRLLKSYMVCVIYIIGRRSPNEDLSSQHEKQALLNLN